MRSFVPVKIAYNEYLPHEPDESLAPILFLHGLTATKEDWTDIPQIIANKTKRKAYAIDARNHGDSGYSDISDLDTTIDDLFHFIDNTVKARTVVLVGHSMGGVTSIRAALRQPERVEMLFVEDMYTRKCSSEFFENMAGFITLWMEGVENVPKDYPPSQVIRFVVDYVCSKLPLEDSIHNVKESLYKPNVQFLKKPDGGYDVKFNKEVILKMAKDPNCMTEPRGQFFGPAYFVYGGKSRFFVGLEEEEIKKHFPAAMLIEIKEAAHTVHTEFPEEFIDIINKCLSKT